MMNTKAFFTPLCFALFCFNAPCPFNQFLNLRPVIFGWRPLAELFVFICLFDNIVIDLRLFHILALFQKHQKSVKQGIGLYYHNEYITLQKFIKCVLHSEECCIIPHDVKVFVLGLGCKKNRSVCKSKTFRNVTYEYNILLLVPCISLQLIHQPTNELN
jgi:hypothetical protein